MSRVKKIGTRPSTENKASLGYFDGQALWDAKYRKRRIVGLRMDEAEIEKKLAAVPMSDRGSAFCVRLVRKLNEVVQERITLERKQDAYKREHPEFE